MATRRERVVLELEDRFTKPVLEAAAATSLLDKKLDSLSGQAVQTSKTTRQIDKDVDGLGKTSKRTEKDIDKLSGRLRILADVAAILGPTLAPIGAVSIAAIGGMANQLGFVALGAGTTILAVQGLGDALKALNKADLEPTAQNLEAARIEMERLSPAAQDFAKKILGMKDGFQELRDLAASGLFPGLSRGLDGMESALPRVERIVSAISTVVGDIAGDAGESLGSSRWAPFLDFLAAEGPDALRDFAAAAGNTGHALAELWMATDPLNDSFGDWLVGATADLDRWAQGLDETEGFQDFLDYVRETGPQVGATLGALANAALQIVEAAAPLGGPVLKGLEAAADVISAIADSDLGTPIFTAVTALALFNRTMAVTEALSKKTALNVTTIGARAKNITPGGIGKAGLVAGGLAVAGSGVADKAGLSNTASLGLMGLALGPWGAAAGLAAGAVLDLSHANDELEASVDRVSRALRSGDLDEYAKGIRELKDAQGKDEGFLSVGMSGGIILDAQIATFEAAKKNADALRDVADAEADVSTYNALMADGLYATKSGLDSATMSATEFRDSLIKIDEQLAKRSGRRAYRDSLRDFEDALKKAPKGTQMDDQSAAGDDLQAKFDAIITSAKEMAKTLEGVDRVRWLDKTRDGLIKAAIAAGNTRKQAEKLVDRLYAVDKLNVSPTIGLNTMPATVALNRFLEQARRNRIVIPVTTSTNANLADQVVNRADGGEIPGPRHPYGDKILMLGAPGEHVITNRNGEADQFRADRAAGLIPGYAGGGTVGGLRDYVRSDLDMKAPTTLKQWNAALRESTKVVDKERSKREDLLAQADDIRSSITSGYRSDIFASDSKSNIWQSNADRAKSGTGDIFSTLMGDTANLGALKAATAKLKSKGLNGAALADLLSNGSLEQVQAFANGSAADVQRYENLYNQREKSLVSAGNAGASAAFGPQLAASRAALAEARAMNKKLDRAVDYLKDNPKKTADGLARAIRGAAPKRPRKGN